MRPGKIPQIITLVQLVLDPLPEYQAAVENDPAGVHGLVADYATLLTTLSEEAEARGVIPTIVRTAFERLLNGLDRSGDTLLSLADKLEAPSR